MTAEAPNPQLYENSPLAGSSIEATLEANPEGFFNSKKPNLAISHENPRHRAALLLRAQGFSLTEIAQRTGYTIAWLSQLCRQPWAQEYLIKTITEAGKDAVEVILQGEMVPSIMRLIEERDNEKAKPSDRIAASNSLLDRHLGKPTQRVESKSVALNISADIGEVDRQLAELEREEKRLTGKL